MSRAECPAETCVVMPVYNEERSITGVLDAVRRVYDGWVIVVDDGSTDGTAGLLESRRDVLLVRHPQNRGYGASLRSGFRAALEIGVETVITMDCDGQHEPRHISEFCAALASGAADIVSGSRYLPASGAAGTVPRGRRAINERITRAVNAVTGWNLSDAFCGFKAYRAAALRALTTDEPGYAMPLELWARAWQAGLRVREIPVERIYNDTDRSFGRDLDDPERRYAYYTAVWERALASGPPRCDSPAGLTREGD